MAAVRKRTVQAAPSMSRYSLLAVALAVLVGCGGTHRDSTARVRAVSPAGLQRCLEKDGYLVSTTAVSEEQTILCKDLAVLALCLGKGRLRHPGPLLLARGYKAGEGEASIAAYVTANDAETAMRNAEMRLESPERRGGTPGGGAEAQAKGNVAWIVWTDNATTSRQIAACS